MIMTWLAIFILGAFSMYLLIELKNWLDDNQ
jgi:hypothetical protein